MRIGIINIDTQENVIGENYWGFLIWSVQPSTIKPILYLSFYVAVEFILIRDRLSWLQIDEVNSKLHKGMDKGKF